MARWNLAGIRGRGRTGAATHCPTRMGEWQSDGFFLETRWRMGRSCTGCQCTVLQQLHDSLPQAQRRLHRGRGRHTWV